MQVFIPNFMTIRPSASIRTSSKPRRNGNYCNQLHRTFQYETEKIELISNKRWKLTSERSIRSKSALDYQEPKFDFSNQAVHKSQRNNNKTCLNPQITLIHSYKNNQSPTRRVRIRNLTKLSNTQQMQAKPSKITPFLLTRSLPYHQRGQSQATTSSGTRCHRHSQAETRHLLSGTKINYKKSLQENPIECRPWSPTRWQYDEQWQD